MTETCPPEGKWCLILQLNENARGQEEKTTSNPFSHFALNRNKHNLFVWPVSPVLSHARSAILQNIHVGMCPSAAVRTSRLCKGAFPFQAAPVLRVQTTSTAPPNVWSRHGARGRGRTRRSSLRQPVESSQSLGDEGEESSAGVPPVLPVGGGVL